MRKEQSKSQSDDSKQNFPEIPENIKEIVQKIVVNTVESEELEHLYQVLNGLELEKFAQYLVSLNLEMLSNEFKKFLQCLEVDHVSVLDEIRELANKKNPQALFYCGTLTVYQAGRGATQNDYSMLRAAAKLKHKGATAILRGGDELEKLIQAQSAAEKEAEVAAHLKKYPVLLEQIDELKNELSFYKEENARLENEARELRKENKKLKDSTEGRNTSSIKKLKTMKDAKGSQEKDNAKKIEQKFPSGKKKNSRSPGLSFFPLPQKTPSIEKDQRSPEGLLAAQDPDAGNFRSGSEDRKKSVSLMHSHGSSSSEKKAPAGNKRFLFQKEEIVQSPELSK